jgi:hypothetical protein
MAKSCQSLVAQELQNFCLASYGETLLLALLPDLALLHFVGLGQFFHQMQHGNMLA